MGKDGRIFSKFIPPVVIHTSDLRGELLPKWTKVAHKSFSPIDLSRSISIGWFIGLVQAGRYGNVGGRYGKVGARKKGT